MDTSFVPNGQELQIHTNDVKYLSSSNEALKFTPSLGISWSTCVNTRILIRRLNNETAKFGGEGHNNICVSNNSKVIIFQPIVRELRVLLSPALPFNSFCYFTVNENGLVNV